MKNKLLLYCAAILALVCFFFVVFSYLPSIRGLKQINPNPIVNKTMADIAPVPVKTFNILVIPGHDAKDGGANYKDIYERNLAAIIGAKISKTLDKDPKYKVEVTRDVNAWNPVFEKYFADEKQNIIDWKNERQKESKALMADGKIKYVPDMALHSNVTPEVSVKLYGMNKWANENNIDLVVNLHFNDSIRPNMNFPGQFRGFTIFIPENQMKNSAASRLAAQDVFNELKKVEPPELDNLLEDQSLIALGASGTLNPPSMLIEYAYIYEKELLSETERGKTLDQMAQQTVLGIEDYFNDLSDNK